MSRRVFAILKQNMRRALSQGRIADAGNILMHLKSEDPLGIETRGFELEFYLSSKRLTEANILSKQLCHLFPESGRIFFLAGKIAYRRKHYQEAASRFRESHRIYPHWQTQFWLGKTLTQMGRYQDAESLLIAAREHTDFALIDLAWLCERKNDFNAALNFCNTFLKVHPHHEFVTQQRIRITAKMLEPEELIEEVTTLAEFGETVSDSLLPEFVDRLFQTGQSPRARDEISARIGSMDTRAGTQLAWICYRAQAYDLASTLFLTYLKANLSNYKYIAALESAAAKCNRLPQVLDSYRAHVPQSKKLLGRIRSLSRRTKSSR